MARARARNRSTRAVHLVSPYGDDLVCGEPFNRPTKDGFGWIAARRTNIPERATCARCRRFAAESLGQREARIAAEKAKAAAAFAKLNERKKYDDAWTKLWRVIAIESLRPDAMVAMDLLGSGRRVDEVTSELLARVCAGAVMAHRFENPRSRGERLYIYRAAGERSGGLGGPWGRRVTDVVCRFCNVVIERDVDLGSVSSITGTPNIAAHVVPCALKFLAGRFAPQPTIEEESPNVTQ